jgi:hypothetical protein
MQGAAMIKALEELEEELKEREEALKSGKGRVSDFSACSFKNYLTWAIERGRER